MLRHLNYRSWFAIAEFVDNSIQSAIDNHTAMVEAEGPGYQLKVTVEIDSSEGRITVRDNAAGIDHQDYRRAFRAAQIPPDCSGLSEFGMGMKSAACWFAGKWQVRTSALGEGVERLVRFDIAKIVQDSLEELQITERNVDPSKHFTEIVLYDLNQPIQGRTIGKIKEHLASIYRVFLRERSLVLVFGRNEELTYTDPAVLVAPYYKTPDGPPIEWRKEINFDLGRDLSVSGFAAVRATASTSNAGFALFRRKRLIEGSVDETYRPEEIFGKSNSFRYQRLFGELHLTGFDVSHTKDGFRWDDQEEAFLSLLREHLNNADMPLLTQAEEYRVRPRLPELAAAAQRATDRTAETIEREAPPVLRGQFTDPPSDHPPPPQLPPTTLASERVLDLPLGGEQWRVVLELTNDDSIGDWLSVSDNCGFDHTTNQREIHFRMSLVHPFMVRFVGADEQKIEAVLRLAAGLALAETVARESGVRLAGTIRRNLNELLFEALSKP